VKLVPPAALTGEPATEQPVTWGNRGAWLKGDWWEDVDPAPVRLVNALLFIGTLLGIYVIGRQLGSPAAGWTMAVVFCVFPGTLECLPRPEIMLPTLLLTWTIALAVLPAGSLLATLCLVLAGIAWPWAWLGLPVLLAYFARRGWQAAGSFAGLAAGVALLVVGLATLVQPALPRAEGSLAAAGLPPHFTARLGQGGTLAVSRCEPVENARLRPWYGKLWCVLVESESLRVPPTVSIDWGIGVEDQMKLYREINAPGDALPVLQSDYRRAAAELPAGRRLLVALRTLLDATSPVARPEPTTPVGTWELWAGSPVLSNRWALSRRIVRGAVGLLTIWAALTIFIRRKNQPRHLLGGLLAVTSSVLLASVPGAVTNLVWLLPTVLALGAACGTPQEAAPASPAAADLLLEPEPPPRITAEN